MGRSKLIAVSLGAHVALGFGLGSIPPRKTHETIAIRVSETKKKPPPPHVDPPPVHEAPAPHPMRAKAAPPQAKAQPVTPSSNAQASSSLDALPDFGLSLSGGGGGLAIPSGGGGGPAPTSMAAAKVLSRAPLKEGECVDPPAKPKLLSRPTPAYTDAARAAGVAGKVRVEITVDAQGHVVSVRVIQGLGYGLDESALAAARALAFEPAVRCGRPSAATFKIGFNSSP
jgi:periplasmic protein TonB